MRFSTIIAIASILILSGCAWFGVEKQESVVVDKFQIRSDDVGGKFSFKKVEIGASIDDVVKILGNPKQIITQGNSTVYKYSSRHKARSGATICIGIIPIPARTEVEGEYNLYFSEGKLTRITSLETHAAFHGVYVDDSGSGTVNGEKSKCDI